MVPGLANLGELPVVAGELPHQPERILRVARQAYSQARPHVGERGCRVVAELLAKVLVQGVGACQSDDEGVD
jgi:hypothetical protein